MPVVIFLQNAAIPETIETITIHSYRCPKPKPLAKLAVSNHQALALSVR